MYIHTRLLRGCVRGTDEIGERKGRRPKVLGRPPPKKSLVRLRTLPRSQSPPHTAPFSSGSEGRVGLGDIKYRFFNYIYIFLWFI